MTHAAGCLCGAVRFTITADPLGARTCWCRLCQYLGGGTATANVVFPRDKVSWTGHIRYHESIADSGNHMRRGFCPKCGTPLTSEALERPHLVFLRIGALDDPDLIGPDMTLWTSQAPDWACISDNIPRFDEQAPPVA
ncbi:GFA family protein [Rhizorhabdus sp.]|uniref:GFA family protein n=1 Tax=Rhizorhabdus sp. TaxID=1968843 RepID=UPI001B5D3C01|nr:GFA family protein [Rhizorhabdus sp.]MBP8234434.1 GFA family protein [Rhizorhabdus sp.]